MRRMLVALVLGALLAMLIAGGVALADVAEPDPGNCNTDPDTQGVWCKGTKGDDKGGNALVGTPNGDRLDALAGNDEVYGLGGTDALYGRDGSDVIHGDDPPQGYDPTKVGTANWDALFGGTGPDTLVADDPEQCDQENCVDVLYAGQDADRDTLTGGAGADVYVVKKRAFKAGLANSNAPDADVIIDDQTLTVQDGHQLQEGDDIKPDTLHNAALAGGPHLYFYP